MGIIMKYENNKIVYEVGDWVVVSEDDGTNSRYFRGDTVCYCTKNNYYSPLNINDIDSYWDNTNEFCVNNIELSNRHLRPATQEEINKASEEEKLMVGSQYVTFNEDFINVGCQMVSKDLFLKIGKKAGWL